MWLKITIVLFIAGLLLHSFFFKLTNNNIQYKKEKKTAEVNINAGEIQNIGEIVLCLTKINKEEKNLKSNN